MPPEFLPSHQSHTEVVCLRPRPGASLRLFCFHHAGGAASYFRDWAALLPESIEVCSVQQPGRERLFFKPHHRSPEELISHTLGALAPWLDRPFAFLGHSFGALVAYVCTRTIINLNRLAPEHLFLSGCRAFDLPSRFEIRSSMSDGELAAILEQLGGVPRELADNQEFLQIYISILRGDIALMEKFDTWRCHETISIPISAFGGTDDVSVSCDEINQWKRFTSRPFEAKFFPGGHFFITQNASEMCATISDRLGLR